MTSPINDAFREVQAVYTGWSLYGPEHPSIDAHAAAAAVAAKAAHQEVGGTVLVAVIVEGRVVCRDRTLASSASLASVLMKRVQQLGARAVVLRPGVAKNDILELVSWLATADSARRPAADAAATVSGIATPTAHQDNRGTVQQIGRIPLETEETRGILEGLAEGNGPSRVQLDRAVAEISAATSLHSDSLIPAAQLKSHDEYTFVHSINVAMLASALASSIGLSGDRLSELTLGALLHDVGKVKIPKSIIGKTGKLTDEEFARVRRHPVDGAQVLLDAPGVPDLAAIVAYEHHMCRDGTGYPTPARPRTPHIASEIVHIADVFDALRTVRPYRAPMTTAEALGVLSKISGTAFDSALLDVFVERVIGRVAEAQPRAAA
ncbi:MAG: HD domain-containing phosphohydrolase [Planctomycetota bacterium]